VREIDDRELWPAPAVRARWQHLMRLLVPRPGERMLDVGCGSGQAVRYLGRRVQPDGRVVGVDRPATAMRRLGETIEQDGLGNVAVLAASAKSLPFPDASFDAVICVNVLEAVSNREQALREIRRVLKPGGRALVAHDDYESQAYACTDRELGRRATLAYACSTFASYATSDGQMGRYLWPLFVETGFADARLEVLPLVETEYREPLLGWQQAQFPASFTARVSDLTDAELDAWRADLEARSARGEYLYCLNLYVCLGRR
jgi:SAM-dependent methyltransferase